MSSLLTIASRRMHPLVAAGLALAIIIAVPLTTTRAQIEPSSSGPLAIPAGNAFTFQGRLEVDGVPAEGPRDFRFTLYDDAVAGMQIGSPIELTLPVLNGVFSIPLDFGQVFSGQARWLLVETRTGAEPFVTIGSRQALTATPYALYSLATAPHGHFGDYFQGSTPSWGLGVENSGGGWGIYANSNGTGALGSAIYANNSGGGVTLWTEGSTADTTMVLRNAGTGQLIKGFDSSYTQRFSVASNGFLRTAAVALDGLAGIGPATLDISQPDALRNLIYADVAGVRKFYVSPAGAVHAAGQYFANGADLAEHIDVTADGPGPGDVVEVDPDRDGHFRLSSSSSSKLVAGVISTSPGVVLGTGPIDEPASTPQLALAGRVPVKVTIENGPILPGDLLVSSSTPGHAMKAPVSPAPGTVIGKSLGQFDGVGEGQVTMLVMLR